VRLPKSLLDWVREQSAAQHVRPSGLIRRWIAQRHAGGAAVIEDLAARLERLDTRSSPARGRPDNPQRLTRTRPRDDRSTKSRLFVMADTTTVKVQTSTRDLLLEVGASRRQSADQVILAALTAMRRDERRQVAAAEARAIKDDPADLDEVRAIQQDMAALHEG